ncbi:MAG: haloacid dehalogenase-like hydrolase [Deltaproteobacteria bacterium]|nr:haloacid dehalogenase-like hydrolase [Deltaproteobacteria bacterium]
MTACPQQARLPAPARRLPPAQLLARLDLELGRVAGPAALAFDGDGTLWHGDVGEALFAAVLRERAVRPAAAPALRALARRHGLPAARGEPTALAAALLARYRRGALPERAAFEMMAWAYAGFTPAELDAFVARALRPGARDGRPRRELGPVLRWARRRGIEIWVVSASPRAAVTHVAARLGLPAGRILAMTPVVQGGLLAARLERPTTYGAGKLRSLRAASAGYDAAMLRAARLPVAVGPAEELLGARPRITGLVALAPES